MVSEKFITNLEKLINRQLKKVLARTPTFQTFGSAEDQPKGPGDPLATKFIPLRRSEYSAREYLMATIPVRDPNLSAIHLATPILNIKRTSVQGVATLMAVVPYPVPETYIERRALRLSRRLLPHDLVVYQGLGYQEILEQDLIRYPAVVNINNDRKLCKTLAGSLQCDVEVGGLSSSVYKIKLDRDECISGVFTIVPFQGLTLLISREAGQIGARADNPRYDLAARFAAFSGVASYIAAYPQAGQEVGTIYADPAVELLLDQVSLPDPSRMVAGTPTGVAAMARGDLDWTDEAPPEAVPSSSPAPAPEPAPTSVPATTMPPLAPAPYPVPELPTLQPELPQPTPAPPPVAIPIPLPMPMHQPSPDPGPKPVEEELMLVPCPGCGTGLEVEAGQASFVCPICHNAYARQD